MFYSPSKISIKTDYETFATAIGKEKKLPQAFKKKYVIRTWVVIGYQIRSSASNRRQCERATSAHLSPLPSARFYYFPYSCLRCCAHKRSMCRLLWWRRLLSVNPLAFDPKTGPKDQDFRRFNKKHRRTTQQSQ